MATHSHSGRSRRGKPGATRQQIERSQRFERARRDSLRPEPDGRAVMYGWHTVTAALQNPARRIRMLLATRNAARRLNEEGVVSPVVPHVVQPTAIDERLAPNVVHQGVYLETDPLPSLAIEDLSAHGVVLVLDQITDPHNVGAIFRSAAAFAVSAIVTTRRHSSDATGALAKVACGALEYVPLVNVQNLARALNFHTPNAAVPTLPHAIAPTQTPCVQPDPPAPSSLADSTNPWPSVHDSGLLQGWQIPQ